MTVGLYVRISDDHRGGGRGEGVATQTRWGREYAAQHWPGEPVRVFTDNDLSASNPDVYRPAFDALRVAIRAGEITRLWTVEQTRLERTEVGWFAFAAELDAAGITEVHTRRDGIIRTDSEVAGIKAVLAAGEARRTKKRIRDRVDVLASEGRPSGGRTYGYAKALDEHGRKTLTIIDSEAEVIRETTNRILAGWSLARIASDLADRGIVGPLRRPIRDEDNRVIGYHPPAAMSVATVKSIVSNLTVVARRVHKGLETAGCWPAVLDDATWHAVRDRLAAPRVVTTMSGKTAVAGKPRARRRHLLTGGLLACGLCGADLVASVRQTNSMVEPKAMYWCSPARRTAHGVKACGRIGIMAEPLEQHVLEVLFAELDKPEFVDALLADDHGGRRDEIGLELRAIEAQRNQLAAEWSGRAISMDEWRTAREALTVQERDLRAELAAIPTPVRPRDLDVLRALRTAWPGMNLDERRDILTMFVGQITVMPARRGGATPQPVGERLSSPDTWWRF